jgi:hypothetical protein
MVTSFNFVQTDHFYNFYTHSNYQEEEIKENISFTVATKEPNNLKYIYQENTKMV